MRCSIQMPMLMTELNRQKDGLKSHWPGVVSGEWQLQKNAISDGCNTVVQLVDWIGSPSGVRYRAPFGVQSTFRGQCFGFLTSESCSKGHWEDEHSTDGVDDAEVFDQQKTDDSSLDLAVSDIEHDADVGRHGDEEDDEDE